MNTITAAEDLARNSRVVLDLDDTPHLVDSAKTFRDRVIVHFSSGVVRTYGSREPVVTREA